MWRPLWLVISWLEGVREPPSCGAPSSLDSVCVCLSVCELYKVFFFQFFFFFSPDGIVSAWGAPSRWWRQLRNSVATVWLAKHTKNEMKTLNTLPFCFASGSDWKIVLLEPKQIGGRWPTPFPIWLKEWVWMGQHGFFYSLRGKKKKIFW